MTSSTYIFAGGGTGGHIYPALAIAEHLARLEPDAEFKFIVSEREIDRQILTQSELRGMIPHFVAIPALPFGGGISGLWKFRKAWKPSVVQAGELIKTAKSHGRTHLVAMGGFVAAPAAAAAKAADVPITLVNIDAVPGKANRLIARDAARVLSTYKVAAFPTWQSIPPIVRSLAVAPFPPAQCRLKLGLLPDAPTLLITGASQGARTINNAVVLYAQAHADDLRAKGVQIIHQTGAGEDEGARLGYQTADLPAVVRPFFREMGLVWGAADAAIGRAGAGTVAEAWANAVPTIFMPYPHHKDQHQRHNAQLLVDAGGAVVVEDLLDARANVAALEKVLPSFLDRSSMLSRHKALHSLPPPDGAQQIAQILRDAA